MPPVVLQESAKSLLGAGFGGMAGGGGCTESGHLAVDGLHSVETTAVTTVVF
jgi:hypothetical protein